MSVDIKVADVGIPVNYTPDGAPAKRTGGGDIVTWAVGPA